MRDERKPIPRPMPRELSPPGTRSSLRSLVSGPRWSVIRSATAWASRGCARRVDRVARVDTACAGRRTSARIRATRDGMTPSSHHCCARASASATCQSSTTSETCSTSERSDAARSISISDETNPTRVGSHFSSNRSKQRPGLSARMQGRRTPALAKHALVTFGS